MKLHENKVLFRQAIIATAQAIEIPETYIEKDYWVTYALKAIFSDPIGVETISKAAPLYPSALVSLTDFQRILISS